MITHERLREVLHYDPVTGVFTRLVATARRVKIGDVAGGFNSKGYRAIRIDGRTYQAHRLAWLWMTGALPSDQIDHWNLNKGDNRWANLRDASPAQNQANSRPPANNTSGFKGVSWDKPSGKWRAQIQVSGKRISLGYRNTKEESAALYVEAAGKYFGEFARAA